MRPPWHHQGHRCPCAAGRPSVPSTRSATSTAASPSGNRQDGHHAQAALPGGRTSHALEGGGPGLTHPQLHPFRRRPPATTAPGRSGSPPRPGRDRWSPGHRRHGRRSSPSPPERARSPRRSPSRPAPPCGPGTTLTAGDLTARPVELPPGTAETTFATVDELVGATTIAPLAADEIIQRSAVLTEGRLRPPAHEFSFPVERERAVDGDLEPGETVDLLGTFGSGPGASTSVLAREATVVAVQSSGRATIGGGGDLVLTVALESADAVLDVAHAARVADLTVIRATRAGDGTPTRDTVQHPTGGRDGVLVDGSRTDERRALRAARRGPPPRPLVHRDRAVGHVGAPSRRLRALRVRRRGAGSPARAGGRGRRCSSIIWAPGLDRDLIDTARAVGCATVVVLDGSPHRDWVALGAVRGAPDSDPPRCARRRPARVRLAGLAAGRERRRPRRHPAVAVLGGSPRRRGRTRRLRDHRRSPRRWPRAWPPIPPAAVASSCSTAPSTPTRRSCTTPATSSRGCRSWSTPTGPGRSIGTRRGRSPGTAPSRATTSCWVFAATATGPCCGPEPSRRRWGRCAGPTRWWWPTSTPTSRARG